MTKETLGEISHTNPYTGEVFGETQTYTRGAVLAADGGEADAIDTTTSAPETLGDVSHTPPNGSDSAQRVYERGEGTHHE